MRYVFSDPHFDSENIRRNANRPFQTVDQMNNTIISNYNQIIQKSDVCYWLGDIMYDAKKDKVRNLLRRMNGHKYLIMGNHDRNHSAWWWLDCGFEQVFKHPVYDAENYIMLSHEPLEEFGNLGGASIPSLMVTRIAERLRKEETTILGSSFGLGLS